jgi:hypothetical protein
LAQGQFDIAELARREGVTGSYVTRVVRLAFLSPLIVEGILHGRQRLDLTCPALLEPGAISARWTDQASQFGSR